MTALSVAVPDGAAPPTEFRIFTAETVTTSKGDFVFDAEAAKRVLADYAAQGNELMVDYDHAALNTSPVDPALSGRAAGWFGLEMRGGELWAVNVRWTEPAAAALLAKEWRYMSPAFQTEDGRIVALLNVALTNIPATKKLEPLMAAGRVERPALDRRVTKLADGPSFDAVQSAICAALKAAFPNLDPDKYVGPWVVEVFDATCIYEVEGKLFEAPYTFDGVKAALGAPAVEVKRTYAPVVAAPVVNTTPEPAALNKSRAVKLAAGGGSMDPKLVTEAIEALTAGDSAKALEILKALVISAAGGDAVAPVDEVLADSPPADDEEKKAEVMAATKRIVALAAKAGKKSWTERADLFDTYHASHIALESERQKAAAEQVLRDAAEYRKISVERVTLAGIAPALVWETEDKNSPPKKRWLAMSLADYREVLADEIKASGKKAKAPVAPQGNAASGALASDGEPIAQTFMVDGKPFGLSARHLAIAAETKCDPAVFAMNMARRAPTVSA